MCLQYEEEYIVSALQFQDSLGGKAQTALIICCSPAAQDGVESLSALRFGARAASIVNTLQVERFPVPIKLFWLSTVQTCTYRLPADIHHIFKPL